MSRNILHKIKMEGNKTTTNDATNDIARMKREKLNDKKANV
jgi:hypothetical protein